MKISTQRQAQIDDIVGMIRENMSAYSTAFTNPSRVKDFVTARIGAAEREHFLVLFLSTQHKLISDDIMFSGTIDAASVWPREIAKRALELNAKAVILAHNHPSGIAEPSQADVNITKQIKLSLDLFDISVLDHVITGAQAYSFAEHGLIA